MGTGKSIHESGHTIIEVSDPSQIDRRQGLEVSRTSKACDLFIIFKWGKEIYKTQESWRMQYSIVIMCTDSETHSWGLDFGGCNLPSYLCLSFLIYKRRIIVLSTSWDFMLVILLNVCDMLRTVLVLYKHYVKVSYDSCVCTYKLKGLNQNDNYTSTLQSASEDPREVGRTDIIITPSPSLTNAKLILN